MNYLIVGTGNISNTYIQAISKLDESHVVGCISRSGKKPVENPDLPTWPSLEEVDAFYDAAVVATPNGEHHKGIIAAANAGKHVLVEKPLDISVTAVEHAIAACKRAGVTLAVAYQHRTAPDNRTIKTLLDKNVFGRIFAVDLAAKFYRPQAYYDSEDYRGGFEVDGGGPFIQQASHNLDIYTWFFGLPTRVVSMMDTFTHDIEAEDHGAALLRHGNGMITTVVASTATKPGFAARLEVHTEKGSFTLTDHVITEWHIEGLNNPSDANYNNGHSGATSASVADTRAHQAILRDFEHSIACGIEPIANAESAKQTTQLIDIIYVSALKK